MDDGAQVREFLEGGWIQVEPTQVEAALASLWQPAAEQTRGEGEEELPAVSRLSLGTLAVVCDAASAPDVDGLLRSVAEQHPCRAVMAVVEPSGAASLEAHVAASCYVPVPGRPQVCSERILLRAGSAAVPHLAVALLPLLEADVPATLWWLLPEPPPERLAAAVGRVVERCLLDLNGAADPAATVRAFGACGARNVVDVAWWRAARWREATAQMFDGVGGAEATRGIDRIEVITAADRAGQMFPAALLAGWAAGRLGWAPQDRRPELAADESDGGLSSTPLGPSHEPRVALTTVWRRPDGATARVSIATTGVGDGRPGRLQALTLAGGEDARWSLERQPDRPRELLIRAHHRDWCRIPTRVPVPRPDAAEVLLLALTSPPAAAIRDQAFRYAAWMLGWQA